MAANRHNTEPSGGSPLLVRNDNGLSLTDGSMTVRGDFSRMLPRISPHRLQGELLVKAAKIKGVPSPVAVDATAGLGEDSLLLAAAGFEVHLFERNETIAALLEDALQRACSLPELADIVAHMHLHQEDSMIALNHMEESPDVVLLDPMFPAKRKSAQVKKKLHLLQSLEKPCEDERALLDAALAAKPRKIVVKRPMKGAYLAGRKPDYSLSGKAIRYDVIVLAR